MSVLSPVYAVADPSQPGDTGWYAQDEQHRRVLGPFRTQEECAQEIEKVGDRAANISVAGGIAASG